jgi:hypothetical protein
LKFLLKEIKERKMGNNVKEIVAGILSKDTMFTEEQEKMLALMW